MLKKSQSNSKSKINYAKQNRGTLLPSDAARATNDVVAIIVFIFCLLLAVALSSYSVLDNAWSSSTDSIIYHNNLGAFGAYLSDLFYYNLGYSSWMIVACGVYFTLNKLIRKNFTPGKFSNAVRFVMFLLLILSSSTLEFILFNEANNTQVLPYVMGGACGKISFNELIDLTHSFNLTVFLLLSIYSLALSFVFKINWLKIADFTGFVVLKIFGKNQVVINSNLDLDIVLPKREVLSASIDIVEPPVMLTKIANVESNKEDKIQEKKPSSINLTKPYKSSLEHDLSEMKLLRKQAENKTNSINLVEPLNEVSGNDKLRPIKLLTPSEASLHDEALSSSVNSLRLAKPVTSQAPTNDSSSNLIRPLRPLPSLDSKEDTSNWLINSTLAGQKSKATAQEGKNKEVVQTFNSLLSSKPVVQELVSEANLKSNSEVLVEQKKTLPNHFEQKINTQIPSTTSFSEQGLTNKLEINQDVIVGIAPVAVNDIAIQKEEAEIKNIPVTSYQETKHNVFFETSAELPSIDLLNVPPPVTGGVSNEEIQETIQSIEQVLSEFGIDIKITSVETGPVITRYEFVPPRGVRSNKVLQLATDLARNLMKDSIRVVETIKGKNTMGLEVPNNKKQNIYLRDIFSSPEFFASSSPLTLSLGKDVAGKVVVADLKKMPHLLVAGTTGSGKSVAVNAMILSILYKSKPDEVKFIMIDPKMVELSPYQDMPHLLAPVILEAGQSANALKWAVNEMERRYLVMSKMGVRHIESYNERIKDAAKLGKVLNNPVHPELDMPLEPWPYIVIVIDELADLMDQVGKSIEKYISRIAQKARAIGIHLIIATQRPDATVVTGLIKSNIPSRISFQLRSNTDSRIILGHGGAETLLGHGDMLFLGPTSSVPSRAHGAFVSDQEVENIVQFLKDTGGEPIYDDSILDGNEETAEDTSDSSSSGYNSAPVKDKLHDQVIDFLINNRKCSISSLQTAFGIGYNRAARIMFNLDKMGVVRKTDKGYELNNVEAI